MTRQKSFKRLVRSRMEKTGESYTAARAKLLAAEDPKAAEGPALTVSDEVIRERTGRGWEEWFELLDDWGASERTHTETARWLREAQEVDGWSSQAVTVSYERARMGRAVGQRVGRLRGHRAEDRRRPGRAPLRGVRRRVAAPSLAARR